MRYVVVGVGAIGGTIAARLHSSGHQVLGVARGDHHRAIDRDGLLLRSPDGDQRVLLPVVNKVANASLTEDDVVLLAMKSQDTLALLSQLAAAAPSGLPVVCAQNGVANEPEALRWFSRVYGMVVMSPSAHLKPGVVAAYSTPVPGILDLGLYPEGDDELCRQVAADLSAAGYSSRSVSDVSRWKYAKLIINVGNAVEAVCGPAQRGGALTKRLQDEAREILDAHGIEYASAQEDSERRGDLLHLGHIDGEPRPGGSAWQSVRRGTGVTEVDFLCGEVVRLARLLGREAPANAQMQRLSRAVATGEIAPESVNEHEVLSSGGACRLTDGQAEPAEGVVQSRALSRVPVAVNPSVR